MELCFLVFVALLCLEPGEAKYQCKFNVIERGSNICLTALEDIMRDDVSNITIGLACCLQYDALNCFRYAAFYSNCSVNYEDIGPFWRDKIDHEWENNKELVRRTINKDVSFPDDNQCQVSRFPNCGYRTEKFDKAEKLIIEISQSSDINSVTPLFSLMCLCFVLSTSQCRN